MLLTNRPTLDAFSNAHTSAQVSVYLNSSEAKKFSRLMQSCCFVRIQTGFPIRQLVTEQLGIPCSYLENDIKVLFYNYSPVDDVDTAYVSDGSTLALSAAMPGLVGAAMRKDGLSWLRDSITYSGGEENVLHTPGILELKLFNLVMVDQGPMILSRGVCTSTEVLLNTFDKLGDGFCTTVKAYRYNAATVSYYQLVDILVKHGSWVYVNIIEEVL